MAPENVSYLMENSSPYSPNSTGMTNQDDCRPGLPRTPAPGTVPYYVGVYVLPVVFVVGILGNTLNLIVLNSKGMRTKTAVFLSAMAASDLAFFITMVFFNLHVYDTFASSENFMKLYIKAKVTLMTFANWFSTASIWIAVAVTVERLVAIYRPLHARLFWNAPDIIVVLTLIYVFSFYLFVHNWFWMWPTSRPLCGQIGRRVYGLASIKPNDTLYNYVMVSQYVAVAGTVFIPFVMLMFLNSLLLYFLRKSRRDTLANLVPTDTGDTGARNVMNRRCKKRITRSAGSTCSIGRRTAENKVAFMVSVIIVSFVVFLSPSAFTYMWEMVGIVLLHRPRPPWLPVVAYVSNQLVAVNKATNFVLYCTAGKNFRRKLIQLIRERFTMKRYLRDSRQLTQSLSRGDNCPLTTLPGTSPASRRSPAAIASRLHAGLVFTEAVDGRMKEQDDHSLLITPRRRYKETNEKYRRLKMHGIPAKRQPRHQSSAQSLL